MTYSCRLLEGNKYNRISKIFMHFDRKKYQSKDSRFDACHIYGGFNIKNKALSKLLRIIYSDPNFIFHDENKIIYPQLLQKGLLSCYDEFKFISNFLTT